MAFAARRTNCRAGGEDEIVANRFYAIGDADARAVVIVGGWLHVGRQHELDHEQRRKQWGQRGVLKACLHLSVDGVSIE
ncbi:hypothetical protein D7S89_23605 [Trinickia fusca]|uniref:Uncharacterized protein n=1 Tax=Trinickia fusca TaxID=2419777 RepID=A0A494X1J2_9BURK|nr:hypothetical protein D7S89_23605 [Trinickia fusca]